ncbi:hypothetical protein EJ04DRAFT_606907 [Polyplosphaeria fusca]|uniref:Uncharacterized protein n=1 Tax=Polyplosphaeria fusca TaxID=682080 RepID=A0A9P4UZY6_9PLEO|nr:hypothetical protein EJ04DRAFT_606907 [Polyplosphaeria fusca]
MVSSTRFRSYSPPKPESLFERRRRWCMLLQEKDYYPLISEVLALEIPKYPNSTVFLPSSRPTILRECFNILCSASSVLSAAITGTLSTQILHDPALQSEYKKLSDRACVQPSIYIHLLTSPTGTPPTPSQYLLIRSTIQNYISPSPSPNRPAWLVDTVSLPIATYLASADGFRKYLSPSGDVDDISPRRISTLSTLCTGISTLCTSLPASQPLPFAPAECGYARDAHARIAQHRARRSSNYIMNLMEDVCGYLFSKGMLEHKFEWRAWVVYLVFGAEQAGVAEMLVSGLMQVWVEGGGGVNGVPAGLSTASAGRVERGEWDGWKEWVRGNSGLVREMEGQRGKVKRYGLGKEEEVALREALRE